jgi:hypothetical protein
MDESLRALVQRRAGNRCEYCRLPQDAVPFITFHVEHIVAKQHLPDDINQDDPSGLALSCDRCNAFKGPNLSSIDQETGEIVSLFHPRINHWDDHFRFDGAKVVGITPSGRATVRLLNMNDIRRIDLREQWLEEGGDL